MSEFEAVEQAKEKYTWAIKSKRHQGTYKVVPNVDWEILLVRDFGHPDWAALYPLNAKGQPTGILSPRMACKLFHDAVFIIKEGEKAPKYVQDRIPDMAHKCYKKKQWRKQFFEAMRRVVCRLALGKGFRPNCVAEDVFIHTVLNASFELGWRRIAQYVDPLPESDCDKDFTRVTRLGANEEIGALSKSAAAAESTGSEKKVKATVGKSAAAIANAKLDVKSWFQCYELSEDHLFDHIVVVKDDDMDNWSISTGSASAASMDSADTSPRARLDSANSVDIAIAKSLGSPAGSPRGVNKMRSNSGANPVDLLTMGIGVKRVPGKPRSNSAISALSMDESLEHEDAASPSKHGGTAAGSDEASMDSLAFAVGTSASVF
jgi:hypothetical protein